MSFETELLAHLLGDPQVETAVDERVYFLRLPEHVTLPAVVFRVVSAPRDYTQGRVFPEETAWVRARVQFDAYADTADDVIEASGAIRGALSGYDGDMEGTVISGSIVTQLDDFEQRTEKFRRTLDITIAYEELASAS